jgi:hypothetical protein
MENKCFCDRENCKILQGLLHLQENPTDLVRMETIELTDRQREEIIRSHRKPVKHAEKKNSYVETLIHHFKGNVGSGESLVVNLVNRIYSVFYPVAQKL